MVELTADGLFLEAIEPVKLGGRLCRYSSASTKTSGNMLGPSPGKGCGFGWRALLLVLYILASVRCWGKVGQVVKSDSRRSAIVLAVLHPKLYARLAA